MGQAQKGHGDERVVDAADSNVEFARAVLDEFRRAHAGEPSSEADRDARGVAIGLATIKRALDREVAELGGVLELPSSGLVHAVRIVDSLTTGRGGPVWRLIDGVRSGAFRPQKAPADIVEILGRWHVVGFVRAHQEVAGTSEAKSILAVIDFCQSEDFSFGAEQIKGWSRRFRETEDIGPDIVARDLIGKAQQLDRPWPLLDRLIRVGQTQVWAVWSVAKLGVSPHSTP